MRLKSILLSFLFLGLLTSLAFGHEWYPTYCCSEQDCKQVLCSYIEPLSNGTYKFLDLIFKTATPSPDNACHVCINATNEPKCLFIPMPTY